MLILARHSRAGLNNRGDCYDFCVILTGMPNSELLFWSLLFSCVVIVQFFALAFGIMSLLFLLIFCVLRFSNSLHTDGKGRQGFPSRCRGDDRLKARFTWTFWSCSYSLVTLNAYLFCLFYSNFYIFMCLFILGCAGSLVAAFGLSLAWCSGFSLRWPLSLGSTGSRLSDFSSCDAHMWNLPGARIEPVCPMLQGRFLTTGQSWKPWSTCFRKRSLSVCSGAFYFSTMWEDLI